jgi:hypothetical protein
VSNLITPQNQVFNQVFSKYAPKVKKTTGFVPAVFMLNALFLI